MTRVDDPPRTHVHDRECEAPAVEAAQHVRIKGYHCLDGRPGFKLALRRDGDRWLLYLAHLWHPGWSILDVTDPTAPELLSFIAGPQDVWTIQIQVADDLMLTALERPPPGWGADPPGGEPLTDEGCIVWSLDDPLAPRRVGAYRTGAGGTHRNYYAGGDLAFMAAAADDAEGRLLAIVDVSDPTAPREVGRWGWPSQWHSSTEPRLDSYMHGPAYVVGDRAYVSYGRVGAVILEVGDLTDIRLLSRVSLGDAGSRIGCHSAVPYKDEQLLLINGEAIDEGRDGEWNYAVLADISDVRSPKVVGALPMPRPHDGGSFYDRGGRFGPHNQHHHQGQAQLFPNDDLAFMTYFNAGLRIFDIADPFDPSEVAFFLPAAPRARCGPLPSALVTQFEDVLVDARGYIYCTDKNHGLFVLEMEAR